MSGQPASQDRRFADVAAFDAAAILTKETASLDRMERQSALGLTFTIALLLIGVLLIAASSSVSAERIGGVAIFLGFFGAWSFARWRRLLPQARETLKESPLDLLLERKFQLSRYEDFRTKLWAPDSEDRPLAWFSSWQWCQPMWMTADKLPARVYGAPSRRAVVVVSCSKGVLVGRIGLSDVDQDSHPKAPPRGLGWLFKPIGFPGHEK